MKKLLFMLIFILSINIQCNSIHNEFLLENYILYSVLPINDSRVILTFFDSKSKLLLLYEDNKLKYKIYIKFTEDDDYPQFFWDDKLISKEEFEVRFRFFMAGYINE